MRSRRGNPFDDLPLEVRRILWRMRMNPGRALRGRKVSRRVRASTLLREMRILWRNQWVCSMYRRGGWYRETAERAWAQWGLSRRQLARVLAGDPWVTELEWDTDYTTLALASEQLKALGDRQIYIPKKAFRRKV